MITLAMPGASRRDVNRGESPPTQENPMTNQATNDPVSFPGAGRLAYAAYRTPDGGLVISGRLINGSYVALQFTGEHLESLGKAELWRRALYVFGPRRDDYREALAETIREARRMQVPQPEMVDDAEGNLDDSPF